MSETVDKALARVSNARDRYVLFIGHAKMAEGSRAEVALALHAKTAEGAVPQAPLIFNLGNGYQLDLDVSGTQADVAARYGEAETPAPKKRGRPKLGVEGREVTLLPRHWEWLERQRGGASAAIRRLVDQARAAEDGKANPRAAQDRTTRFMGAMAGNLAGFEEATRALYAGNEARFAEEIKAWPKDVCATVRALAEGAFAA